MKLRSAAAVFVGVLLLSAGAWAQNASGGQATAGGQNASNGQTITLDQAIQKALSDGIQAQLNGLAQQTNINKNDQTHASYGWGIGATGAYTHNGEIIGSGGSGGFGSSSGPGENVQASVKASHGGGNTPPTSITLTGSHTFVDGPPTTNSSTVTLGASQTIWDGYPGGAQSGQVKIADYTLQQQNLQSDAGRLSLIYSVKQAYYSVASAQAAVRLNEQTVQQRRQDLDQTNALYDAGRVSQIDVLQAQINLEQAQANLTDSQNSLVSAMQSLSALMGLGLDAQYSVQEIQDVPVPTDTVEQLVQMAYSRRADLQQLIVGADSLKVSLALAKASSSPVVKASGQVSYTHGWESGSDSSNWNAGVQVSVPVADSGAVKLQVEQAQRNIQSNQLQVSQLKQQIASDVNTNFNSVMSLRKKLDLAQQNLTLQQKQYQLTETQFQQGLSSNLDVLTASVNLTSSENNLQQAKTQLQLAILKLQNSVGE